MIQIEKFARYLAADYSEFPDHHTSVPLSKFARVCGWLQSELRKQKGHSLHKVASVIQIEKFARSLAADYSEFLDHHTSHPAGCRAMVSLAKKPWFCRFRNKLDTEMSMLGKAFAVLAQD